jgi:hypothetical protein
MLTIETPKKDKYGFSYSTLPFDKLTQWVNADKLLLTESMQTDNSIPFFFSHLEADLGIAQYQEILGLFIDHPNVEVENIINELYLDVEKTTDNCIEVHRILFNKEVVAFLIGKGELYRHEIFTIYNADAYKAMLQFIRDTYENVPNN